MLATYSLRSLKARGGDTLVLFVILGAVSWACAVCLSFLRELEANVSSTGHPQNLIVTSRGARGEGDSTVTKEQYDLARAVPGQRAASLELLGSIWLDATDGRSASLTLRGVEPVALEVHDQVKVIEGRAPAPGAAELMLGRQVAARYRIAMGDSVPINETRFTVVGVFDAARSSFEREAWANRSALGLAMRRPDGGNVVVLRAESAAAAGEILSTFAQRPTLSPLSAQAEPAFREALATQLRLTANAVALIITVVAVGAIFAATSTLQAAALRRMREFIVLVVLGFRRRRVAWMLFLESLMIAVPAAATGALLASPLAKAAGIPRLLDGVTEVRFEFSPAVVGMVVAIGVVMGILGAMQPALHISRVDLVSRSQ